MPHTSPSQIAIREVSLRDGLQNIGRTIPTATKLAWLSEAHTAGLGEFEVDSFVPARLMPQLTDTAEVLIHAKSLSDSQWQAFCDALGLADLKADPRYHSNNARVSLRSELLHVLREQLTAWTAGELATMFENAGLPFAPIRRPEELYEDEHLLAIGGLADIALPDGERAGRTAKTMLFPFTLGGQRLGVRP